MEPTLPHPPRTQVIAAQPPRRQPDGSVLLRVHVHAGPIDVLFPPGLWPQPAHANPAPHRAKAPAAAPTPTPAPVDYGLEELKAAVAEAMQRPGGFGRGIAGARAREAFALERGIDPTKFLHYYTTARFRAQKARQAARLQEAAR